MRVFDAAVSGQGNFSNFGYLFRGTHYYKYQWTDPLGVVSGYPLPIKQHWNRLPYLTDDILRTLCPWIDGIDAAVNGQAQFAGKALLFCNDRFQLYDWSADTAVDKPQELKSLGILEPFASGVDAAVTGQGSLYKGHLILFRGKQVAALDWNTGRFSTIPISSFKLPEPFSQGIDAAMTGRASRAQYAYFFKGDRYVRFDWSTMSVSVASPPYPDHIDRMNGGKAWPGLNLSQPAVTSSQKLSVKIIYGAAGAAISGVPLAAALCDIWTGPPLSGFTSASNAGIVGGAAFDTQEVDIAGASAATIYRFKHLHGQHVHVKLEPHSPFVGSGHVTVTLTVQPTSGPSQPSDTIKFIASTSGYAATVGGIEFTSEFLSK